MKNVLLGMQFKNPEVLYALFLLLIPILVHLFQLRRFEKTAFTNVKFLQKVILQTRKSSQLKKWLVLCTRLLAFTALIFAFAQPYFANRNIVTTEEETVIYLDNSFSMQAKGEKGNLLNRAVQDLLNSVSESKQISLYTNTETYKNTTLKSIRNELLQLPYAPSQETMTNAVLKGKRLFSNNSNTVKKLILISDFQQKSPLDIEKDSTIALNFVQVQPVNNNNISLDSVYISEQDVSNLQLTAIVKNSGMPLQDVPVSLFDGKSLIAKTSVDLISEKAAEVTFSVPSGKVIQGRVTVEDNSLQFDNTLYFNINASEKIKVLAINEAKDDFLKKLYTTNEFSLTSASINALNYNAIATQQLIVLNELKNIPNPLLTALKSFKQNGGALVIIPAKESNLQSYNELLQASNINGLQELPDVSEKKITRISFSHPLFTNVFEKQVTNFQYPKVVHHFFTGMLSGGILSFENNSPFLVERNNTYLFTAPINTQNSNFQNSPLIVPVFYNIANNSLKLPNLYYTIGKENIFDVQTSLSQDAVLAIASAEEEFIPLQQTSQNKVRITTEEFPTEAGIYTIKSNENNLQQISYNFDRSESVLQYHDMNNLYPQQTTTNVTQFFEDLKNEQRVASLWKWFVIFALLFLCIEILILKFVK